MAIYWLFGNVIGGGDWSEDRLIPDCVRALESGQPVVLRYPDAIRPWQHVLEPLSGYLTLAEALVKEPKNTPPAVNFGPDPASFCTVREVVDAFGARFAGKPGWVRDPAPQPPEAQALTLSSALARHALGWHPRLDLREHRVLSDPLEVPSRPLECGGAVLPKIRHAAAVTPKS